MKAKIEQDDKGRKFVLEACDSPCAVERGMRILGGKWTGSILWHLKDGSVRFNDLSRMIGGASKKMLTERLRHLESHGLIEREILDTRPVGVAYKLTKPGERALVCLEALRSWSESLELSLL